MTISKFASSSSLRLAAAAMIALSSMINPVNAAPTVNLGDGRTAVVLSNDFINAVVALGLSVNSIGEGTLRSGIASFPVTGGAIDLQNAKGEINHTGGLFLANRSARVELSSFNIDTTGAAPVLTGLVTANGNLLGRVPLFTLGLPQLTLPLQPGAFNTLFVPGVKVGLTSEAASALNGIFGVNAFTAGFNIGTASVSLVGSPERRRLFIRDSHSRGM
jgi:hypothetical protein